MCLQTKLRNLPKRQRQTVTYILYDCFVADQRWTVLYASWNTVNVTKRQHGLLRFVFLLFLRKYGWSKMVSWVSPIDWQRLTVNLRMRRTIVKVLALGSNSLSHVICFNRITPETIMDSCLFWSVDYRGSVSGWDSTDKARVVIGLDHPRLVVEKLFFYR